MRMMSGLFSSRERCVIEGVVVWDCVLNEGWKVGEGPTSHGSSRRVNGATAFELRVVDWSWGCMGR